MLDHPTHLRTAPAHFVEQARLSRAKALLESSDWTADRVADSAGFGSTDALDRAFRKHLGVSPMEYRKRFHIGASRIGGVVPIARSSTSAKWEE